MLNDGHAGPFSANVASKHVKVAAGKSLVRSSACIKGYNMVMSSSNRCSPADLLLIAGDGAKMLDVY
jgi:hypothetical protein